MPCLAPVHHCSRRLLNMPSITDNRPCLPLLKPCSLNGEACLAMTSQTWNFGFKPLICNHHHLGSSCNASTVLCASAPHVYAGVVFTLVCARGKIFAADVLPAKWVICQWFPYSFLLLTSLPPFQVLLLCILIMIGTLKMLSIALMTGHSVMTGAGYLWNGLGYNIFTFSVFEWSFSLLLYSIWISF